MRGVDRDHIGGRPGRAWRTEWRPRWGRQSSVRRTMSWSPCWRRARRQDVQLPVVDSIAAVAVSMASLYLDHVVFAA